MCNGKRRSGRVKVNLDLHENAYMKSTLTHNVFDVVWPPQSLTEKLDRQTLSPSYKLFFSALLQRLSPATSAGSLSTTSPLYCALTRVA